MGTPLPRFTLTPRQRTRIESLIEFLIELLDRIDGDPDDEPGDNGIADLDALLAIERAIVR